MQERILETADRLFYGQGIRAVGVDTIAAEIGISKRTLYNYFPSKDELIVAYLSRRLKPAPPSDLPPVEQILGNFERLERTFATGVFRGCPFVNAVAELKEPAHAANKIALAFKEQRRLWFRDLLVRLDVDDPDTLATAAADPGRRRDRHRAGARRSQGRRTAGEAARVLLKAAGVRLPADESAAAASPLAGGARTPGGRSRASGRRRRRRACDGRAGHRPGVRNGWGRRSRTWNPPRVGSDLIPSLVDG